MTNRDEVAELADRIEAAGKRATATAKVTLKA